jgi:hypothetical protein
MTPHGGPGKQPILEPPNRTAFFSMVSWSAFVLPYRIARRSSTLAARCRELPAQGTSSKIE